MGTYEKISINIRSFIVSSMYRSKVVNYNTARLDNIEAYLANNKAVKPSENLEKLVEEGKVEYTEEYLSLEKEADKWKRERAQQQ